MRQTLNWIYRASGYLAAFFVFAIFVVMIGQTILRELGMRTGGTDDIVAWFCAASAFLAMADTFKRGDFVRVGLLLEHLSSTWRHRFEILTLSIAALFVGYLAFWAGRFTYESWQFNDMANGLIVIPMWIPQLSFVFGAGLLCLAVIDELCIVLSGQRPTYVVAVEERHARGDFSEDM
jgi:TRAP-type C4-dicarboxylate transport system permease small subunit